MLMLNSSFSFQLSLSIFKEKIFFFFKNFTKNRKWKGYRVCNQIQSNSALVNEKMIKVQA